MFAAVRFVIAMSGTPRTPIHDQDHAYEVEWTTISYRTIIFFILLGLFLLCLVIYLIAPHYVSQKLDQAVSWLVSARIQQDQPSKKHDAHFVNIDGTVRVRKGQSQQWIRADFNTSLEKGDFIQTSSDGVAQIIFTDGTNYVLKPDSLIVVEESQEDPVTKATKVAVQVTTGAVDLSTGKFGAQGSVSQVSFQNATASLGEDSRAVVRSDPKKDVHEITVDAGQADVTRGSSSLRLGQYEQATFNSQEPGLTRKTVIAPPALDSPPNMALTVSKDPKTTTVPFSWHAVPGAVSYHLMVSPSGMFSNLVVDKRIQGKTSFQIEGLEEGNYYWEVTATDARGVESQPSAPNKFNLVQQMDSSNKAFLEVNAPVIHGRVVEVTGKTEPGSTVIINNEQVFSIAADGTFRHFTSPLPRPGENQITITAQNRKGDTNTIHKSIVIE
ncbi:MAG TPA: hypothetical protein VKV95_04785 [Terriglobia bacterium]|nr:hypothetical protein [Terriglobia bacterium]